jgi:hypothetical protein
MACERVSFGLGGLGTLKVSQLVVIFSPRSVESRDSLYGFKLPSAAASSARFSFFFIHFPRISQNSQPGRMVDPVHRTCIRVTSHHPNISHTKSIW